MYRIISRKECYISTSMSIKMQTRKTLSDVEIKCVFREIECWKITEIPSIELNTNVSYNKYGYLMSSEK